MKQHETVWLECEEGEKNEDWVSGYSIPIKSANNVIVLAIEELRECFDWGMGSALDAQPTDKCFQDFLTHKGITIP